MTANDIAKWLSRKEEHQLDLLIGSLVNHHIGTEFIVEFTKSIAAQRELMEKHEWNLNTPTVTVAFKRCPECIRTKLEGHKPDCAWAKQIDGFPRVIDDAPPQSGEEKE